MPSLLLAGAGGHARACIDVVEQAGQFEIGGLIGLPDEVGTHLFGYPVLGTDDDFHRLRADFSHALVTVGQIKSPDVRIRFFDALVECGYSLPVIVSPRAYVSRHAVVGAGSVVMHGAVVNAAVVVGQNCILNSQSLLEHDVVVGDHTHVSTGARINSGVSVGMGTFVGSGSSVRQCLTIGDRCVIGMGQRVLADCESGSWLPPSRSGRS